MHRAKYLVRLVVDIAIVAFCLILAKFLFPYGSPITSKRYFLLLAYATSFWYFASQITFLYNEFLTRSLSQEIITVVKTILIQNIFIITAFFFLSRSPLQAKWFVACFMGLEFITLPFIKYFSRWYYASTLNKGKRATSLLVIGAGE